MSSLHITYASRSGTEPEEEFNALAAVYKLVLDCHAKKKGGPATASEDARKDKNVDIHPDCT